MITEDREGRKERERSLALSHLDKNDSCAFVQTMDKNVEQDQATYRNLGMPLKFPFKLYDPLINTFRC